MTMTAGLLALFGLINLVPGVYDLVRVTADGQDWSGNSDVYPPVVLLLAALVQVGSDLRHNTVRISDRLYAHVSWWCTDRTTNFCKIACESNLRSAEQTRDLLDLCRNVFSLQLARIQKLPRN